MRRTERLFQIIQILRRYDRPITAHELAEELETSLRTVYRDTAELIAQRVPIRGEAGIGYVLEDGYDMPPLMLTADELEAAVLGAKWVEARGDAHLQRGARDLIAKLTTAVPKTLQPVIVDSGLVPISFRKKQKDLVDVSLIRSAIRDRHKVALSYSDEKDQPSERVIWPFLLAYSEDYRMICAWCELRQAFRHFRTDRVSEALVLEERIPERISTLRKRWQEDRRREAERNACNGPDQPSA